MFENVLLAVAGNCFSLLDIQPFFAFSLLSDIFPAGIFYKHVLLAAAGSNFSFRLRGGRPGRGAGKGTGKGKWKGKGQGKGREP